MEARSQLRHRPTCGDTTVVLRMTSIILAECAEIVNAADVERVLLLASVGADPARHLATSSSLQPFQGIGISRTRTRVSEPQGLLATKLCQEKFLPFLPQGFSGIIDRAPHLHNFPITT